MSAWTQVSITILHQAQGSTVGGVKGACGWTITHLTNEAAVGKEDMIKGMPHSRAGGTL